MLGHPKNFFIGILWPTISLIFLKEKFPHGVPISMFYYL